ncbi:hypothetical protein LWI29_037204 [Acer saccharum]|uniref:Uncharacterized protein n=1 Tax=Acer saccharum TaxID=4024 RepID=A0AA39S3I0_ACESA|nr:hypothetical protein LWI29_037204 [Acer saccharum]
MASKPGILTDWPWKPLGNFKYVILAPWAVHSIYSYAVYEESERDLGYLLIFPFLLLRMLHNQIWISFSRYRTAKGNNRIVDKAIDFDQVDRERSWDDQVLFNGILFYIGRSTMPSKFVHNLPLWKTDGIILVMLLHSGPVEFLYYWFHRALHHHFLYSRYHSHHHSSIATEPITSVIHPFAEHIVYFMLFAIPLVTTLLMRNASIASFASYVLFIDFMNNMGHCNFEFVPKWLFSIFPPLKYLMYTPSFHSLHHTQFRTNYSLFMPIYDYIYGTMDKSSDSLHEASLKRDEETPDVVHLTHLTTPESIYHLRIGFASVASKPLTSKSYLWLMWPFTCWSVLFTRFYGHSFVSERNTFQTLKLHTWVLPRYLVQGEGLNKNGEIYIERNPKLKIKVVDGSSLAAAIVVNSIPKGTTQVVVRGKLTKVACATASVLCKMGIKVSAICKNDYEKLKLVVTEDFHNNLVLSSSYDHKIWLVGDELKEEEQSKAAKGTIFIPFSQLPPRKLRKDCFYHTTPAMLIPPSLENMHSCENWLPRMVMSAWRIAGIIHALEEWNTHECGNTISNIDQVWQATLRHGFRPLVLVASPMPPN